MPKYILKIGNFILKRRYFVNNQDFPFFGGFGYITIFRSADKPESWQPLIHVFQNTLYKKISDSCNFAHFQLRKIARVLQIPINMRAKFVCKRYDSFPEKIAKNSCKNGIENQNTLMSKLCKSKKS